MRGRRVKRARVEGGSGAPVAALLKEEENEQLPHLLSSAAEGRALAACGRQRLAQVALSLVEVVLSGREGE